MNLSEINNYVVGLALDISPRQIAMLKDDKIAEVLEELNLFPIPPDQYEFLKKMSSPEAIYAMQIIEGFSQRHVNFVTNDQIIRVLKRKSSSKFSLILFVLAIAMICIVLYWIR